MMPMPVGSKRMFINILFVTLCALGDSGTHKKMKNVFQQNYKRM